jgi:hypothetical protein
MPRNGELGHGRPGRHEPDAVDGTLPGDNVREIDIVCIESAYVVRRENRVERRGRHRHGDGDRLRRANHPGGGRVIASDQ